MKVKILKEELFDNNELEEDTSEYIGNIYQEEDDTYMVTIDDCIFMDTESEMEAEILSELVTIRELLLRGRKE